MGQLVQLQHELREKQGSKATMLGYHQQMGMQKGTNSDVKTANKVGLFELNSIDPDLESDCLVTQPLNLK